MSKRETEKITIRAFKGDKEKLASMYPHIGYNKAMRHVIHSFIAGVEAKAQHMLASQQGPAPDAGNIDINKMLDAAKKDTEA